MLTPAAKAELVQAMANDDKMLGQIFNLQLQGVTDAKELTAQSTAANRGVVYNNLHMIAAIMEGRMPTGATISRHGSYAINRLIKDNPTFSDDLTSYLLDIKARLLANSENPQAVTHDQVALDRQSESLAKQAALISEGIYVYSFPTYIHFGTVEDEGLTWYKIGSTKNSVWQRIVDQNRQTSMPEDPKLLRIYHKAGMDIDQVEKNFHETLDAVGHERSAARRTRAGKEWFATSLEAIDQIAKLMNLEIERYELIAQDF